MALWIALTTLCAFAAVLVSVPIIRRYEQGGDSGAAGSGVFADQLKEIERDRGNGVIEASEAALAANEVQRRLIAAAKPRAAARPVSPGWRIAALAAAFALVVLGSMNLYALRGRPDLAEARPTSDVVATIPAESPGKSGEKPAAGAGQVDDLVAGLAKRLAGNPNDAEGWRMLGWSYFNMQRYEESAGAYEKAMTLAPENPDYKAAYAESLVQAADGIVVPKAGAIFSEVLKKNPQEMRSRFYEALALEQSGGLADALDKWIALMSDAPEDAGWLQDVRQRISDLGAKTGRDVKNVLADAPAASGTPDTAGLAGADQKAVIDGMIGKLAAKLEADPKDRDGWAMMIRSLKVKGDEEGARSALAKASEVFADDPGTRMQIVALAKSLGVETVKGAELAASSAPAISQEDVAAAQAMPEGDKQEMIKGMVARLADRLDKSPHDAEGWVRLMRSRMVLDQADLARDAFKRAASEFSGDAASLQLIRTAAQGLGLAID
jgi:cytochrome c-type biogenesis protein CcmH